MPDVREQFKSCGDHVVVSPDAFIEHPEVMEVGDHVTIMRGFHMEGKPGTCRIGNDVSFHPNCFIVGTGARLVVEEHVGFYLGTYLSLGDGPQCFIDVGHHSHFAPYCVLYGWGGLTIGPYCNIAAHAVFATVGHQQAVTDRPMALGGRQTGPITLVEDVWVAANCTITANTTIARGCIIGANAVVTKDTEPMGLYVGVPARRVRDR